MSRTVTLRDTGFWNDEVGREFEKSAAGHVSYFNAASDRVWQAIDTLESYHEEDIQYNSQQRMLLQLKVTFHA